MTRVFSDKDNVNQHKGASPFSFKPVLIILALKHTQETDLKKDVAVNTSCLDQTSPSANCTVCLLLQVAKCFQTDLDEILSVFARGVTSCPVFTCPFM